MRSPSQPLFKRYELIAILLFLAVAGALAGLKLIY
jgi:hypothetical protein